MNRAESVPFSTVAEVLSAFNVYPGTPTPKRLTVAALPATLSSRVRVPDRGPVAVGVKVTLMVHEVLGGTLVPQLFVCAKSGPVVMLLMVRVAVPVLVKVTGRGLLAVPTP